MPLSDRFGEVMINRKEVGWLTCVYLLCRSLSMSGEAHGRQITATYGQ